MNIGYKESKLTSPIAYFVSQLNCIS